MIIHIIKRDGRKVPFNIEKIANAIFKAAQTRGGTDFNVAMDVAVEVCRLYEEQNPGKTPTVEEIQDLVEKVLIEKGHAKTAKAYILYRYERTRSREMKTNLMCVLNELTFSAAKDSDIKRENANIDGDTAMGTMLKYGSVSAKEYYEMYVLEPAHAKAHREGDIHIHDLDFYTLTTTCTQIDLKKLFTNGFSTGHGFLREPNDIASYSALACIAIQSNQNDQHGGQSIPTFDYAMAEGVKKTYAARYTQNVARALSLIGGAENEFEIVDSIKKEILENFGLKPVLAQDNGYQEKEMELLLKYTDKETAEKIQAFATRNAEKETDRATYQAMEALIHNLNTMNSRAGAQTPFSSINYGTDTTPEGRMVIKNVLLAQEAGLGNGETPIFPIHIFKIKDGINYNPTDPNYDLFKLACRVSAKRLFPNFSFIDAPFNLQYYKEGNPDTEIAYMGCRTRVIGNNFDPSREIVTGRGNLSFTSINLPRLAIKADHNVGLFFDMLEEKMELVIDQLMHRFKIQSQKRVRNYPFLMGQGIWIDSDKLSPDDYVGEVLKHGTLSVGFIGLAETLKALIGAHHGESEEARELGIEIVTAMRKRLDEESKRTGLNFSLLATPAEGLSGRFVRMDAKKYGIIEGVTDREYYTNSFHVPVYYPISAFEKIKIEAPYHELTNAGHISYIELDGDPLENLSAFEKIVRCMKESGIGYGAINHPVDRDPCCGYTGIIGETCPCCGRKEHSNNVAFDRIRRITGYLVGTLDRFNDGKRAEEHDRVKHNV
ncbi:anaerobic ribonucleoside triphosphate reductase [Ruminococcus flavefaciens]|uniref:anaerobic ribonucleoside triphosphate reductase n=1 Tax=Ruminococcus flavefaciens TaxID=1265 RepID=UPI0026F20E57|nr:anaerobic ribonucleoside triphosphate reductase [Ruminococcus flavefaciens]MDD7517245.1 anaerobic ribonucleoside triphosphate reductase [Ruminococcus flavefaciens]MDY5691260.1 anaerobic ribonucleoside triphosphate reductase [Ruminococcus flavefaciens]